MTSDIRIGQYVAIKPNEVKWKCSASNFVDTCGIKLPLATYSKTTTNATDMGELARYYDSLEVAREVVFKEGDPVEVRLGYDGDNTLRFKGFVNRVNRSTPLEVECEGYSYQLKNVVFNKSYTKTKLKNILLDLTAETDIKLSPYIPDLTLTNVWFKNTPGLKVLEWFQKECLCRVFFDFDTLFVGASKFAIPKPTEILRMGWNTAADRELKKTVTDGQTVINIVVKEPSGSVRRVKSDQRRYSNVKEVKARAGLSEEWLKKVANELQQDENYKGYQGDVTAFLVPTFGKGYVAEIWDGRFPERAGNYFVETVEGSLGSGGGRQKLTLRHYGT